MQANRVVAIIGLVAAISLGSWWMGQAIVSGSPGALLIRCSVVVAAGLYYVALYRSPLFQPHRYR
jgi:hypothetical protein